METIFQVTDYNGIPVALSAEVWHGKIRASHPIGHPEVVDYLDDIRTALVEPDLVVQSTRHINARLFYRLRVGRGRYAGAHLNIIVKYVSEAVGMRGYVSTIYLTRRIHSQGRILWRKPTQLLG